MGKRITLCSKRTFEYDNPIVGILGWWLSTVDSMVKSYTQTTME